MLSMALHQLDTPFGLFRFLTLVYQEQWRSHHFTRAVRLTALYKTSAVCEVSGQLLKKPLAACIHPHWSEGQP